MTAETREAFNRIGEGLKQLRSNRITPVARVFQRGDDPNHLGVRMWSATQPTSLQAASIQRAAQPKPKPTSWVVRLACAMFGDD